MALTVAQLAEWVGGTVDGDGSTPLSHPRTLADAEAGDFTFVDGEKNLKAWAASKASAAVVGPKFPADPRPLVRVGDPLRAFQSVVAKLRGPREHARTISPKADIHPTAKLGPNAHVAAFAVVGEGTVVGANVTIHSGVVVGRFCTVGDDVTIHPRAVLYDDCTLGHRVVLHAGAVVGADGFGFRMVNGQHEQVPQLGGIALEDDVEVGANTTIDCGTVGPTRIGAGTKIDNLVMIAHNCRIGRHNILVSQSGVAGSSSTGDFVVLAGQAGVADHLHVGEQSVIGAQCGVTKDVPPKSRMLGSPAMPGHDYMRCVAGWLKLPDLRAAVADLKKRLPEGGG